MKKCNLIEIDNSTAIAVFGGRDENVAKIVYYIAKCIGAFAKPLYLARENMQRNTQEVLAVERFTS